MNKETLKALRESIAHWKRLATGTQEKGEGPYGDYCPLCSMFVRGPDIAWNNRCEGCPVMSATGRQDCRNTPYYKANEAWVDYVTDKTKHNLDAFIYAAKKELKFLQSLLPKRKKTK